MGCSVPSEVRALLRVSKAHYDTDIQCLTYCVDNRIVAPLRTQIWLLTNQINGFVTTTGISLHTHTI